MKWQHVFVCWHITSLSYFPALVGKPAIFFITFPSWIVKSQLLSFFFLYCLVPSVCYKHQLMQCDATDTVFIAPLTVSNKKPTLQILVSMSFFHGRYGLMRMSPMFVHSTGCMQLTSDPKKHIPVGEANVPVRGPLVGGRVVLYTDWHYLHLLLHSKDRATKYTLWGLPRLLWAGEMRPLLGPKANDMAGDLHGKYF